MEDVVFWRLVGLLVLNFDDQLAESRDHEQVLHYAVHVADASGVLEAHESGERPLLLVHLD